MTLDTLRDAITQALGAPSPLTAIAGGDESAAYGFDCDGQAFIARVSASARGFRKDRLIQQRHGGVLPIPVIRAIVPLGQAEWLCISERAEGTTLQDTEAADVARACAGVAAVLRDIGSIDMADAGGFGWLDQAGRAQMPSWRHFLGAVADPVHYDWARIADRGPADKPGALLARLQELAAPCPEKACLVHGDFGSSNVLCADGNVTAVIDWSEALVGDPLYDVANLVFWRGWLDCMEQQAQFYEQYAPAALGDPDVLDCYMLRIGLQRLFEAVREGDRKVADWLLARCVAIAG